MSGIKALRYAVRRKTRKPRAVEMAPTTHVERQAKSHAETIARRRRRAERKAAAK